MKLYSREESIIRPRLIRILLGAPSGMKRSEVPNYLLSRTYAELLGPSLPRRDVLYRIAAIMAGTVLPARKANALTLAPVTISGVTLSAATFTVHRHTKGDFDAKNKSRDQQDGYVRIDVTDDASGEIEGSISARYSFPPGTTATIHFDRGPAATTTGNKTVEITSDENSDTDTFEAVD